MPADATMVAIGCILISLIDRAILVWLAKRSQERGLEFEGERRYGLTTLKITIRPGKRDASSVVPSFPAQDRAAFAQHVDSGDKHL